MNQILATITGLVDPFTKAVLAIKNTHSQNKESRVGGEGVTHWPSLVSAYIGVAIFLLVIINGIIDLFQGEIKVLELIEQAEQAKEMLPR